jgi:hypothetical protein
VNKSWELSGIYFVVAHARVSGRKKLYVVAQARFRDGDFTVPYYEDSLPARIPINHRAVWDGGGHYTCNYKKGLERAASVRGFA